MATTDPVCGMTVDPATAKAMVEHVGTAYYFCCGGCAQKFRTAPDQYLKPKPAGPVLVTLGAPKVSAPSSALVPSVTVSAGKAKSTAPNYVCPMCPEVDQSKPGPCPSCGMALEPETPIALTRTEYTCPMHPEIVRAGPGSCPICGMALEPRTVKLAEDTPELRDMTRRFWISLALTTPLLAIAMGSMLWPHAFMGEASVSGLPLYKVQWLPWLELLLATPAVLWCGWPFFQRGWASVVNRSTNMFTLIAMGTGVAFIFSVVATLFPHIFP